MQIVDFQYYDSFARSGNHNFSEKCTIVYHLPSRNPPAVRPPANAIMLILRVDAHIPHLFDSSLTGIIPSPSA